jgi:hypothetical protein
MKHVSVAPTLVQSPGVPVISQALLSLFNLTKYSNLPHWRVGQSSCVNRALGESDVLLTADVSGTVYVQRLIAFPFMLEFEGGGDYFPFGKTKTSHSPFLIVAHSISQASTNHINPAGSIAPRALKKLFVLYSGI